jgi:hypothetical protein
VGQVLAWLVATHLQSRFLLPLAVPGAALFGLVIGGASARLPRAQVVAPAAAALVLVLAATSVLLYAREPQVEGAGAGGMLVLGPAARTGELARREFDRSTPREQREFLHSASPEVLVNLGLPRGSRVYLLGEATPLYYTVAVVYSTTWDQSLLASAMQQAPDDPEAWAAELHRAGITHVMANFAELARLQRSGFLDPLLDRDGLLDLLEKHALLVQAWPEAGVALYALPADRQQGGSR